MSLLLFSNLSLTSCTLKLLGCIILSRILFSLESNTILSSHLVSFCPGWLLDQFFLSQFLNVFHKSKPDSGKILATVDFSKAFDVKIMSGTPVFTTIIYVRSFYLVLLGKFNLFFLTGALSYYFIITNVALFEPAKLVFRKDLLLTLCSFFMFLFLFLSPFAVRFVLTIWLLRRSPLCTCLCEGHTWSPCLAGALFKH